MYYDLCLVYNDLSEPSGEWPKIYSEFFSLVFLHMAQKELA